MTETPGAEQIETDPEDSQILYVRTFRGLYRSVNGGKSFLLVPLDSDKVMDIDVVAVDPTDGRYVFASVGGNSLYRSSDGGCNWERVSLPGFK